MSTNGDWASKQAIVHNIIQVHRKYIKALFKDAEIIFKYDPISHEFSIPYHENMKQLEKRCARPDILMGRPTYSSMSIRIGFTRDDNAKICLKEYNQYNWTYLKGDNLNNPDAYKWLIELIKMTIEIYKIKMENCNND